MSAPIELPAIDIRLDGAPLASADARALAAVRIHQRLSEPTLCEIELAEYVGHSAPLRTWAPGIPMSVILAGERLFEGESTALELRCGTGGETLTRIRGYDAGYRLRKRQSVGIHAQTSAEGLAREFGAQVGLDVASHAAGPRFATVLQDRPNDLALLADICDASGLYFFVRGRTLHLFSLEGFGARHALKLGGNLFECNLEANLDPACEVVQTTAWDPGRAASLTGSANRARGGPAIDLAVSPGAGTVSILDTPLENDDQALAIGQAELDRRHAASLRVEAVAEGDARLHPGAIVSVTGVPGALAGDYVLTSVDHSLDSEQGFVTRIRTDPPPRRRRERAPIATVATVTQVRDPAKLGRVKVMLNGYDDAETDWLSVMMPAAGAGKGLIAVPDIGDRVLVLLIGRFPTHSLVLGGLYGESLPADSGVDAGRVRRFTFRTPGGQELRLDDEGQAVRLGTAGGSVLEMSKKRVRLHSATDLEIEAPGKTVTIAAARVNFKKR